MKNVYIFFFDIIISFLNYFKVTTYYVQIEIFTSLQSMVFFLNHATFFTTLAICFCCRST